MKIQTRYPVIKATRGVPSARAFAPQVSVRLLLMALSVVAGLACTELFAQTSKPLPAQIAGVQFGLGKVVVAERMMPVTVRITGGATATSGEARISFVQDATQRTAIVRPFSTTPGKTIDVPFVVALPLHPSNVTVTIVADGKPDTAIFTSGNTNGSSALPNFIGKDALAIGVVADGGVITLVPRALAREIRPKPDAEGSISAEADLGPVQVWSIPPTNIPAAPAALDSLDALIIRESSIVTLEPRQTDALRTWLQRGGTVVVVANQPGGGVARLLGDTPEPFALDEVQAPSAIGPAALSREFPLRVGNSFASTFGYRPVRLTPDGQRDGWATILPLNPREPASEPSSGSLAAYGPIGFGRMLVLGFDPTRVSEPLTDEATAQVWKNLLVNSTGLLRYNAPPDEERFSFGGGGSGSSHDASIAIQNTIASLCTPRAPSYALIYVIGGSGLLLAFLIGPFDLVVLGRLRRRHMAWMTAIAWLGIASVVAWFLPDVLRPIPGSANRLEVIDVLMPPAGGSRGPLAHSAALSSIFAVSSGSSPVPMSPSTSFRGVSASDPYHGGDMNFSTPTLQVAQDFSGTALPLSFELRRLTLRSFFDEALMPAPPSFALGGSPDLPRVVVANLPAGARVSQAELLLPDGGYSLTTSPDSKVLEASGPTSKRERTSAMLAQAMDRFAPVVIKDEKLEGISFFHGPQVGGPGSALALPGAESRASALELRDRSGRYAILIARVVDLPPAFKVEGCREHLRSAVYRVAIPLPDSFRVGVPVAPLPPGPSPETPT